LGVAVELAAAGREGGGEFGGGGSHLALTLYDLTDAVLVRLVAGGEVGGGRFEPADRSIEAGGFGSDVGVPALVGVSFSLHVYGKLAGGLAAVPAPLTMLNEPFDLAALVSGSGQPGDSVTGRRVPVAALAGGEVDLVGLGLTQGGDGGVELDRAG
jgi:hypothetical protein